MHQKSVLDEIYKKELKRNPPNPPAIMKLIFFCAFPPQLRLLLNTPSSFPPSIPILEESRREIFFWKKKRTKSDCFCLCFARRWRSEEIFWLSQASQGFLAAAGQTSLFLYNRHLSFFPIINSIIFPENGNDERRGEKISAWKQPAINSGSSILKLLQGLSRSTDRNLPIHSIFCSFVFFWSINQKRVASFLNDWNKRALPLSPPSPSLSASSFHVWSPDLISLYLYLYRDIWGMSLSFFGSV